MLKTGAYGDSRYLVQDRRTWVIWMSLALKHGLPCCCDKLVPLNDDDVSVRKYKF